MSRPALALACFVLAGCYSYRDDLVTICHSDAGGDPALAERIHTRRARQLFKDLAVSNLDSWGAHLNEDAAAAGVAPCPMADALRARAAVQAAPHARIELAIDRDGNLYLAGLAMSEPEWLRRVDDAVRADPEVRAVIAADHRVAYEKVVHVMDLLKSHGVSRLALQLAIDGGT
jgi:hypothetical protein